MARIDTLAKYREFLAAGYTEQQAEVAVNTFKESEDVTAGDLVTKDEFKLGMAEFKTEMHSDFNEFKSEIQSDFNEFKHGIYSEFNNFKMEIREDFLVLSQEFKGLRWLTISFGSAMVASLLLPIKELILAYLTK